jgi:hypothetical protein
MEKISFVLNKMKAINLKIAGVLVCLSCLCMVLGYKSLLNPSKDREVTWHAVNSQFTAFEKECQGLFVSISKVEKPGGK